MLKLAVRMQQFLNRAAERDRGATAVEYGLLVAGIAALIILAVFALGGKINTIFTTITGNL